MKNQFFPHSENMPNLAHHALQLAMCGLDRALKAQDAQVSLKVNDSATTHDEQIMEVAS